MKILSVRRGFLADHSSTSYEFVALDKPLSSEARAAVGDLSSRADPTARRVSFVYHAEGYDIPGGWEPLMEQYYDVMYSESYDWWTLAMAFDTSDEELAENLRKYAFDGVEELGVSVTGSAGRMIVTISCRLDAGTILGGFPEDRDGNEEWDEDNEEEYEDEDEDEVEIGDALLALLARVRKRLIQGDFSPLYAVWEQYGYEDDEEDEEWETPPVPDEAKADPAVAEALADILA
jgi:hypothetical protein